MFIKKVFSTAAVLLLAASQSTTASSTKSDKGGNNCAGNPAQELLIKLTLARQFAIQFVNLYSLGENDGTIEGAELEALYQLAALTSGLEVQIFEDNSVVEDGIVTINEIEAAVLQKWQDTCAAEMKDMFDGVILSRIPGYNVDFVSAGADDV